MQSPKLVRLATVAVLCVIARPGLGQESAGREREGADVQAEGLDVEGGLQAEPSDFEAGGHILGDPAGVRGGLAEHGITIDPVLTIDYAANFRGGQDTSGSAFLHIFNLYVNVDTGDLFGLEGGTVFADLLTQNGQSPSDEAGDFQGVDNFDYDGRTQVNEIWYEQKLFDEALRVKVGKIDANSEFAYAEASFEFVNTGLYYGYPQTSQTMATVPDNAFGGVVFVYPTEHLYAGAGLFDGALQDDVPTGSRGPKTLFDDPSDLYLIGELGSTFELAGKPVRAGIGAFHHTGTFDAFDGTTENGNTGFYAVVDATLYRENPGVEDDDQGLAAFLSYNTAESDITEIDQHVAGGAAWTGLLPTRDSDVVGLGASYVHFSGGAGFVDTGELAIEAFYKLAITEFLSLKADVQYIKDPGGSGLEDALVGLVRLQAAF